MAVRVSEYMLGGMLKLEILMSKYIESVRCSLLGWLLGGRVC